MIQLVKLPSPSLVNLSLMTLLLLGTAGQAYGLPLNRADETALPGRLSGSFLRLSRPAWSPSHQRYQYQLTTGFNSSWLSVATLRLDSGKVNPRRSIEAYGSYPVNAACSLEYQGRFQSKCNKKLAALSAALSFKQTAIAVTQSLSMDGILQRPRRLTASLGGYSSTALNLSYSPIRIRGLQGNLEVRQALLRKQGSNLQAACHSKGFTASVSYQPMLATAINYSFSQSNNGNSDHQLRLTLSVPIGAPWSKRSTQTELLYNAHRSVVAQQVDAAVEASETVAQLDPEVEQRVASDETSSDYCSNSDLSPLVPVSELQIANSNRPDAWSPKMTSDETVATPVVIPSVGERELTVNLLLNLKNAAIKTEKGLASSEWGVLEELDRLIEWRNKQDIFSDAVYKHHNLSLLNYASGQVPTYENVNQYYENVFFNPIKYTYKLSYLAALEQGKFDVIRPEAVLDEICYLATYCYENLHLLNQKGYFSEERYKDLMLKPLEDAELKFNQYIEETRIKGAQSVSRDTFFDLHSKTILRKLLSIAPGTDSLRDGSTNFQNRVLHKLVKEIFFAMFSVNHVQLEKAGLINEQDKILAVKHSKNLTEDKVNAYLRPNLAMDDAATIVDSLQMTNVGLEVTQEQAWVARAERARLQDQIDKQCRDQELSEGQRIAQFSEAFAKVKHLREETIASLKQQSQNLTKKAALRDKALKAALAEQRTYCQAELTVKERIEEQAKARRSVGVKLPLEHAPTNFLWQALLNRSPQGPEPTVMESLNPLSPITTVAETPHVAPGSMACGDAASCQVSEGLDRDKSTLQSKKKG